MNSIILNFLDKASIYLHHYVGWITIVILYAILYSILLQMLMWVFVREGKKRREILIDIQLYKETHPYEIYKEKAEKDDDNHARTFLQYKQEKFPDKYYHNLKTLTKKYNPHPYLLILLFSFQTMISFYLMRYLYGMEQIDSGHRIILYILNLICTGLLFFKGKRNKVLLIFYLLIAFSYWHLNSEPLLFLLIISIIRLCITAYYSLKKNMKRGN